MLTKGFDLFWIETAFSLLLSRQPIGWRVATEATAGKRANGPSTQPRSVPLQEYKQKLARVTQVRKELKSHIQSLPDLSLLPSVTGGLAPLPSAGDLFSTD